MQRQLFLVAKTRIFRSDFLSQLRLHAYLATNFIFSLQMWDVFATAKNVIAKIIPRIFRNDFLYWLRKHEFFCNNFLQLVANTYEFRQRHLATVTKLESINNDNKSRCLYLVINSFSQQLFEVVVKISIFTTTFSKLLRNDYISQRYLLIVGKSGY